jgi:hypothetical protein
VLGVSAGAVVDNAPVLAFVRRGVSYRPLSGRSARH